MTEHTQRTVIRTLAPVVRWARLAEWVAEHGGRFTAASMAEETGEPIEALVLTLKAWGEAGWLIRSSDSGRSLFEAGPKLPRWGDTSPWSALLFGALTVVDGEADGAAIEAWKARRMPPPVVGMASGGGTFTGGAWGGGGVGNGGSGRAVFGGAILGATGGGGTVPLIERAMARLK